MKPSHLYFRACSAARDELPEASARLLNEYDAMHMEWTSVQPLPARTPEFKEKSEAIDRDPLVSVVMEIRRLGNEAHYQEYLATQKPS